LVRWNRYGQFIAQMVKWVQRKETEKQYTFDIIRQGEQGTFTVDVTDRKFTFLNHLKLKTNLLLPSQTNETLALDQIAPGRYQGNFPADEIGEYYFTLFSEDQESEDQPEVFGFGIPYTDEFTKVGVNMALLEQLAELTKGAILQINDVPEDLFAVKSDLKDYGTPLWPYFAAAFLFLLLVNVAVRKFVNLV
jgi:hypothetical protein